MPYVWAPTPTQKYSKSRPIFRYYYAMVMLIIYPVGVPCVLFVMMWAVRDQMNPAGLPEDAIVDKREDEHLYDVEPITAFARIYRPRFWW